MPAKPEPLTLRTTAVRAALLELDGVALPQATLAKWVLRGLVTPSVRNQKGPGQAGALWSIADLARVRLVARLQREGVSGPRLSAIFAYLDEQLAEVLQPRSTARLIVAGPRAYVVRPGEPDIEVPTGQRRLEFKLDAMFRGNEAAARRAAA